MAKKARASQVKGIVIEGLNNILQLAVQVGNELDQIEIPYCFIGGTAYQRWGEPRQTRMSMQRCWSILVTSVKQ